MKYVISHALCTRLCCGLLCIWSTLFPTLYDHGCVMVCFVCEVRNFPRVMYTAVLWFALFMKYVLSHVLCTRSCCGLFCLWSTLYPMRYVHGCVVVISRVLCTRLCCGLLCFWSTLLPTLYVYGRVVVCFVREVRYIPRLIYTTVLWFALSMKYVLTHVLCIRSCCGLLCSWSTLYPTPYIHDCVVVCFVHEVRYIPCVMHTVVLWFVLFMKYVISHALCTRSCCGLFCLWSTLYPMRYAHGCVVVCLVLTVWDIFDGSWDVFAILIRECLCRWMKIGLLFTKRRRLMGIGIPIINLILSDDRLRLIMGIPISISGCF